MKQTPRVLVFHSHGVGQYVRVHAFPEPGETIRAISWDNDRDGGKGSNVAIALGKLGIPTAFFGKLGNDIWAEMGLNWMQSFGVNVELVLLSEQIHTSTGLVMIDDRGENYIVTMNTGTSFTEAEIAAALDASQSCTHFITGFEIPVDNALTGARLAHAMGMMTILNPSPVPVEDLGALPYIDLMIVNRVEGQKLSGLPCEEDPQKLLAALKKRYQMGAVIMTMGPKGSYGYDGAQFWHNPVFDLPVVDTTGAGDAFLACVVAELTQGAGLPQACAVASAYSSLAVTRLGTFPAYPTRAELHTFLQKHAID